MTPLRKRMIQDLRLRNYSPKTIDAYAHCVAAFANHFGKSPQHLSPTHVRQYQIFLVEERKVAWSTFNQAVCALRFFYRVTLGKKDVIRQIPFPRQEKKLPVVLSTTELSAFFKAVHNVNYRTVLMTMYAAGLRVSEALTLRVSDIDSHRKLIHVRHGKGKRDRYVLLPPTLLALLRIRYYGFMANRPRTDKLALARNLIAQNTTTHYSYCDAAPDDSAKSDPNRSSQLCPVCNNGRLVIVQTIDPDPGLVSLPVIFDTS